MTVARGYRWVGSRWVHFRFAGKGPLVVLLHGSPQSGAAVADAMEALIGAGCAALALDTPGNGCSDALAGGPEDVGIYAHALGETLDALGVGRAAFYGFHTGAAHAAAFAGLYPQRVSALALDGFPIWTDAERADLLAHYLRPFMPTWDGAHLAWAWARMEAQSIFFPWYARTDAARMPRHAVPEPALLHENVLDLLRAGDSYRAPYASAFRCDGLSLLSKIVAPTLLCAGARDPLAVHLDRLPAPPAHIEVCRHDFDRPPAWTDIAQWLAARASEVAAPPPALKAGACAVIRRYLGDARAYEWAGALGRPLALLHAPGESIDAILPLARAAAATRPVLALERAHHGESGGASAQLTMREVLSSIGWDDAEIVESAGEAPPMLTPTWDGAHLTRAWRHAWRSALFDPWDTPDAAHARAGAPDIHAIHARAVDLLKSWRAFA